jgi:hypothetical protein
MGKKKMEGCLKIYDKKTFSKEISMLIIQNPDEGCMDLILRHAEKIGIDLDNIPTLLSPRIKDILYKEAISKNSFTSKPKPLELIDEDEE